MSENSNNDSNNNKAVGLTEAGAAADLRVVAENSANSSHVKANNDSTSTSNNPVAVESQPQQNQQQSGEEKQTLYQTGCTGLQLGQISYLSRCPMVHSHVSCAGRNCWGLLEL